MTVEFAWEIVSVAHFSLRVCTPSTVTGIIRSSEPYAMVFRVAERDYGRNDVGENGLFENARIKNILATRIPHTHARARNIIQNQFTHNTTGTFLAIVK